ncbi:DUF4921 family protein [Corynebacterium sp. FDAARGOS 1242]|uniref:DUF4921 family protein n=1 Tax=Corynebacterium sp. FDAARGOS 1242 TaxID=2778078 RepID=UPI001950121D|nr:DUF4921 family protein [Corynebacterium sp. FDAARGOS 1242]QRP98570.1 DUF4921 family protein [Corynebacterium sp. FDAARGOS 1242]
MSEALFSRVEPIQTMADGTVKQVNPFSGTEVWTVPGRGNRPLAHPVKDPQPLGPDALTHSCAFCSGRMLDTPPEKSRILASGEIQHGLLPHELDNSQPLFRRVPNLFEIVSYDYWHENYGFTMDPDLARHKEKYEGDEAGRLHVLNVVRTKLKAAGKDTALDDDSLLVLADGFFGGGHDVIISSRHFVDGAVDDSQLASSGTLSPDEHFLLTTFTAESTRELYQRNRYASYVAVFQNWLAPAGASFDHLHKQLVAIDALGMAAHQENAILRAHPNMYNDWAVGYAAKRNLVIAENDYAVLFAGFGHRYPTLEIFSKSPRCEPWEQNPEEVRGMSDLIHAAHAAVGPDVACNEEWHHRPPSVDLPQPWRVMLKLRVSTLAGFEGGTKVYINTIDPWGLRDRVVDAMFRLRERGKIASGISIATECELKRNSLRYNPLV